MTPDERRELAKEIYQAFGHLSYSDVYDAARHIGVSVAEVERMASAGELKTAKQVRGKWYFDRKETYAFEYQRDQQRTADVQARLYYSQLDEEHNG